MLRSIPFHLNINLSKSFSIFTNRNGRALETVCQHSRDVNAYQHRIYKLDFCSYNFHVFRLLRCGKGDVDVYRFISKHMVQITMCFVVMIPCHRCAIIHVVVPRFTSYFLKNSICYRGAVRWNRVSDFLMILVILNDFIGKQNLIRYLRKLNFRSSKLISFII